MAVGRVAHGGERQKIAVLDVDKASCHFRALQSPAYTQEIPSFVMRQSGVADAMKTMTSENDSAAETMRAGGGFFLGIEAAEREVESVEVFPHFAGDAVANSSGVFASFGDALHNGAWVVGAEGQELEHVGGRRLRIELAEKSFFAGHRKNWLPANAVRLRSLLQQGVKSDVENAGRILRASDVASQPEKGIGDAGEHVSTPPGGSMCLCCRRLARN